MFLQYDTVSFNVGVDDDDLLYTVTYTCMIQASFTDLNLEGGEAVRIYAPFSNNQEERTLVEVNTGFGGGDLEDGKVRQYSHIFKPGDTIRGSNNDESFSGRLHIFRLPESE